MIKELVIMGGGTLLITHFLAPYYEGVENERKNPLPQIQTNISLHLEGFTVNDKEKIAQIFNLIPTHKGRGGNNEMLSLNIKYTPKDVECMAKIVYHEARGEIWEGQHYIMDSVATRVLSDHFPNTVCGVASQSGAISAYNKPHLWGIKPPSKFYTMAKDFLSGKYGKLPKQYEVAFWEGVATLKKNKWTYRNIKEGNYSFKVQIGNQIFWQHKDVT